MPISEERINFINQRDEAERLQHLEQELQAGNFDNEDLEYIAEFIGKINFGQKGAQKAQDSRVKFISYFIARAKIDSEKFQEFSKGDFFKAVSEQNKSLLLQAFLCKKNSTFSLDDFLTFAKTLDPESRAVAIKLFVESNERKLGWNDFKRISEISDDKSSLTNNYLNHHLYDVELESYAEIIRHPDVDWPYKIMLAQKILSQEGAGVRELGLVTSYLPKKYDVKLPIKEMMLKTRMSFNEFMQVFHFSEESAVEAVEGYLGNKNVIVTPQQLVQVLRAGEFTSEEARERVVNIFFSEQRTFLTVKEFEKFLQQEKVAVTMENIGNFARNSRALKLSDYKKLCKLAKVKPDRSAGLAIDFLSNRTIALNEKNFFSAFKSIIFEKEELEIEVVKAFLQNPASKLSPQGVVDLLKKLKLLNEDGLQFAGLALGSNPNVTQEFISDLCNLLPKRFASDELASLLQSEFIAARTYASKDQLIEAINHFHLVKFNINHVILVMIKRLTVFEEPYIENMLAVVNILYKDIPYANSDFLLQCARLKILNKHNVRELGEKAVLDDETVFALASNLKDIPAGEIYRLCRGRVNKTYSSLARIFEGKSLKDCLKSENEVNHLASLLRMTPQEVAELPIADLFSYYDLTDKLGELKTILKKEFLEQVKEEFRSQESGLLVSQKEVLRCSILLGVDPEEIKRSFVPCAQLCDHFLDTVHIPQLTEEQKRNFSINFSDTHYDKKTAKKLNSLVREILLDTENVEKVGEFFTIVLGLELQEENIIKLQKVWKNINPHIAVILQQERGITNLANATIALGHGCEHNLGTQLTKATYACLLEHEDDRALYEVLDSKIIDVILTDNSLGDVIMVQSNPLANPRIRSYSLSPQGMLKELKEVFYKEVTRGGQKVGEVQKLAGPTIEECLPSFLSEEENAQVTAQELGAACNDLLFECEGQFNENVAEIAAYLILCKFLGPAEMMRLAPNEEFEELIKQIFVKAIATKQEASAEAAQAPSPTMQKKEQSVELSFDCLVKYLANLADLENLQEMKDILDPLIPTPNVEKLAADQDVRMCKINDEVLEKIQQLLNAQYPEIATLNMENIQRQAAREKIMSRQQSKA